MRGTIMALLGLSVAAAATPATAATRGYPVSGFARLKVEGPFEVSVHTGPAASVKARGPDAGIKRLVVESRGSTLVISTEKGWHWPSMNWGKNETIHIDVTVPMLEAAELVGSGDVIIDRIRTAAFSAKVTGSGDLSIARLDTRRLSAIVTGSGDLTVAGHTGRADASVTGSGDIRGTALSVDQLTASVTGSGDLNIGPTKEAKARVMGSGDISIAGHPRCTTSKLGSGDIRCGG